MKVNGKDDLKSRLLPHLKHPNDAVFNIGPTDNGGNKKFRTLSFKVRGITCASCVASIESALGKLEGVQSVRVSVLQGQTVVENMPQFPRRVKEALEDTGFDVVEDAGFEADLISSGSDVNKVNRKLEGISSYDELMTIRSPIESFEGVHHVDMDMDEHKVIITYEPEIIIGRRFYAGSYHAIRGNFANMDVLVALGTNASYM